MSKVSIITANLHEACSHDTVNRSTVALWFKWFQEGIRLMEGDVCTSHLSTAMYNALIVIVYMLLDEDG